jgi:serine/threonine protein kinase
VILSAGTVLIGRFEILEPLGKGAHGHVYSVLDRQLDCQIAIKVLSDELVQNSQQLSRFRDEILICRRISHPNIIRVHEFYHDIDCVFYTMDQVDGTTLSEFIKDKVSLSLDELHNIAMQLFAGIEAAHKKGVIHCDLKPDNILITSDHQVYINDFGIAKLEASDNLEFATHAYASPSLLNSGEVNEKIDFYAMAVTLYELMHKKLPFSEQPPNQLTAEKNKGASAVKLNRKFKTFSAFFDRCLSAMPHQQPETIDEIRELWLVAFNQTQSSIASSSQTLWWRIAGVVIIFGFFGFFYWGFNSSSVDTNAQDGSGKPLAEKSAKAVQSDNSVVDSILILPMQTTGSLSALNYSLSDASLAVLYNRLSQFRLRIIDEARMRQTLDYLGYQIPLTNHQKKQFAELLGADYLLTGTLTKLGDQVDMSLQLLDSRTKQLTETWQQQKNYSENKILDELSNSASNIAEHLNSTEHTQVDAIVSGRANWLIRQTEDFISQNRLEQAEQTLTNLKKEFPELKQASFLEATIALWRGELIKAESLLEQLIKNTRHDSILHLKAQARYSELKSDNKKVEHFYQKLIDILPYDLSINFDFISFLNSQGQVEQAKKQLMALSKQDAQSPKIWFELSKAAIRTGDIQRALDEYLMKALVIYKRTKDRFGEANILNAFGVALQRQGRFQQAEDYYQQALNIREELDVPQAIATSLGNLATMQSIKGDFSAAKQSLQKALAIRTEINDSVGVASINDKLGLLEEEQGDYKTALKYYRDALSIRMTLDDNWLKAESMNNIGYIYFLLSQFDEALVYLRQSEQNYLSVNDPMGIIKVRQSLAQINMQQGNWQSAYQVFSTTTEDANALGLKEEALVAEGFLARLSFFQGNFKVSENIWQSIKDQVIAAKDSRGETEINLWLTEMYINTGQLNKARTVIENIKQNLSDEEKSGEQYQWYKLLEVELLASRGEYLPAVRLLNDFRARVNDKTSPLIQFRTLILNNWIAIKSEDYSGNFIETLESSLSPVASAHIVDWFKWQEIQAIHALNHSNWNKLENILNNVLPDLRRLDNYWRQFQFEALLYELKNNKQVPASQSIYKNSLQRILLQIPENNHETFLQLNNFPALTVSEKKE